MLGKYVVNIEVVGTCNLRCPACPMGNYGAQKAKGSVGGKMTADRFRAIVDKLERDLGAAHEDVFLALYSWGEPLIHPHLDRLIRIGKEHGFRVGLSSNLNYGRNIGRAMAARPDELVVSLSGFSDPVYGKTHVGGDAKQVRANMQRLADAVEANGRHTSVFVHYHVYRHNADQDLADMANFCERLRFDFIPGIAYYMPVEKMVDCAEGEPDPNDRALLARLLVPVERQLRIASTEDPAKTDCDLLRERLDIDVDGAVKLCCSSFDRRHNAAPDYLAVDFPAIQRRRSAAELCKPCAKYGIHRIYTLKDYGEWRRQANRTLEQIGSQLRFEGSHVTLPGLRTETSLQQQAIERMNGGRLQEAAQLKRELDALVADKYGRHCIEVRSLRTTLASDAWRRGVDLPREPLHYYFIEGVLRRNLHHRPEAARTIFESLIELTETLDGDREYRPTVEAMQAILAEWAALPV